jgi:hypothetical protein
MIASNEEFNGPINNHGIEIIASCGPAPEKLKKPVDKTIPKQIVSHKGDVYVIYYQELKNLALDYYMDISQLCKQKGLMQLGFFNKACEYCIHSSINIMDIAINAKKTVIIPNTAYLDSDCKYKTDSDIKIAVVHTGKNQKPFYAIEENCAFTDSLVSLLAEKGKLEPYKTNMDFNFKPIDYFEKTHYVPEEFLLNRIFLKKSLIEKLKDLIKKSSKKIPKKSHPSQ